MASNNKAMRDLEKQLEQLRQENSTERIPVSQSCKELLNYCDSHINDDYFLCKTEKTNPFKDTKGPCMIL